MKRTLYTALFLCTTYLFVASSCSSFLQVDAPVDELTSSYVFTDSATAESTIIGLYNQISRTSSMLFSGYATLYPAYSADELQPSTSVPDNMEFVNNSLQKDNPMVLTLWQQAYIQIYQANLIIQNLSGASSLSQRQRDQLSGEAKVIRALTYFCLVNYFGAVPLALTPDYVVNARLSRSGTSDVYAQIVDDLESATNVLDPVARGGNNLRIGRWAAKALLARVYLYLEDWQNALTAASEVINNSGLQISVLDEAFLATSTETVFQLSSPLSSSFNAADGFLFVPASPTVVPANLIREGLLQAFEPEDERSTHWIGQSAINGQNYYYPFKYKIRNSTAGTAKLENNIMLRLSELYLIRAESNAQLGQLDQAQDDIDVIRQRAGLQGIRLLHPGLAQDDILAAIRHEDQVEFFAELGHRWLDLKRWGLAKDVLAPIKGSNWSNTDLLYPIPNSEILNNNNLTQNEGYIN